MSDAPGSWEHGIGEATGSGPDRTFTHYSTNYDPDDVEQPADDNKRKILELQVYHDAGNTEYYAIIEEAVQHLEDGEVVETVPNTVVEERVVEINHDYALASNIIVGDDDDSDDKKHEKAEERIHQEAEEMMQKYT